MLRDIDRNNKLSQKSSQHIQGCEKNQRVCWNAACEEQTGKKVIHSALK